MVGPPKKYYQYYFLTTLTLLSLSFLVIFFLFSSSHNAFTSQNPNNLSESLNTNTNTNNHNNNFTFIIKVLAYNRLPSLSRCLRSLSSARYGADTVHLHLFIDHFPLPLPSDRNLDDSHQILEFVDRFRWEFGEKVVHYRTGNVGLQAQWLEAWWPASDLEFAFVVEDDLEVSPRFYEFVKGVILNYYFDQSNFSPSVYGVSLQRPRFVPGKHGNKIHLDSGTQLFLYQLIGTWGQILFPKPWKEFRIWYDEHTTKGIKPYLDGMVTNGWYKKLGEKIWTPWFIKFIHSRGYFNIYTNFPNERALSVSHRDAGVNYGKTAGPDSQLLDDNSLDINLMEMKPLRKLKWYDFCFREVVPGRIVRTLNDLGSALQSLQKNQTVILVSIFGASDAIVRNLLCHFERLDIRNYIFIGPHSEFLLDLARRGHPVIDADQFLSNIKAQKLIGYQDSDADLMKDILVKAHIIKKCLESSYETLMVDSNVLLLGDDPFHEIMDPSYDFYAGTGSELLVVRNSSPARKIWSNTFLTKVAAHITHGIKGRGLVDIVSKLLEASSVRIHRTDETRFGVNIGTHRGNQSSVNTAKMIYWSAEMRQDLIQKRLEELSLWIIDGDSSCKAVVCHQS